MYNGIGIATPRGTGSSGHVTKNLSHVKPECFRAGRDSNSGKLRQRHDQHSTALPIFTGNRGILEHNRKREIEVCLLDFQELLIGQGCTDAEIEEKLRCKRIELMDACGAQSSSGDRHDSISVRKDSHSIAVRKQEDLVRARRAFGIRDIFLSGDGFDPEFQQRRKHEQQDKLARRTYDKELASDRNSRASQGKDSSSSSNSTRHQEERRRARSRSRDRNG